MVTIKITIYGSYLELVGHSLEAITYLQYTELFEPVLVEVKRMIKMEVAFKNQL